jgi:hypothetical protein
MKQISNALRRPLYGAAAIALLLVALSTAVMPRWTSAYGTPTLRSIQLSTSKASATNVTYSLTFTPATTTQELVVDFCGDTPLIGATCAFAASSVPNVAGAAVGSVSAGGTGSLSTPGSGTPKHTIVVTGLTMASGSPYTITFTGINNPTGTQSFFARVLTYATGDASEYVQADSTGDPTTIGADVVDAGGIAMSTVAQIDITARVMETLSFCVYHDDDGGGAGSGTCGDPASLELGTGTPPVIDSNSVYTGLIDFNLSSNATNGVVVRIKGGTLTSGSNTIAAAGAAAGAIVAGTAKFGVQVPASTTTGLSNPVGTVNADANYSAASGYGLDTVNMATTYGDTLCNSNSLPLNDIKVPMTYGVTASITTPAGVYTAAHQLIATGTF